MCISHLAKTLFHFFCSSSSYKRLGFLFHHNYSSETYNKTLRRWRVEIIVVSLFKMRHRKLILWPFSYSMGEPVKTLVLRLNLSPSIFLLLNLKYLIHHLVSALDFLFRFQVLVCFLEKSTRFLCSSFSCGGVLFIILLFYALYIYPRKYF